MDPEQRQPLHNPMQQYQPGQHPQYPPQQGYYAPPAPAEPAPKRRGRKVGTWIVGGVVALFVIGSLSDRDDERSTVAAVPAPVPVAGPAVPAAVAEPAPAAAQVAAVEPEATPTGIGEGTHVVGTDIEPGTYRSAGATPGLFELCMWSTKDGPASNADIIDLGTANADERQVVEIGSEVGAFESSGCEPWQRVE